jgi:hypothetical protein
MRKLLLPFLLAFMALPLVASAQVQESKATDSSDFIYPRELSDDEVTEMIAKVEMAFAEEATNPPATTTSGRPARSAALGALSRTGIISRGAENNIMLSDAQAGRVVKAFEGLKAKYEKHAEAIGKEIFKVAHLSIGRQAPEIESVDTDEVAFKLSDYRGKVVALDFWGDW